LMTSSLISGFHTSSNAFPTPSKNQPKKKIMENTKFHPPVISEIQNMLFHPSIQHYDKEYWNWQQDFGRMGGKLEAWKFKQYIHTGSNCLDFGAGGGFLLHNLQREGLCKKVMGIEVNPHAAHSALTDRGIQLLNSTELLPDGVFDVVISNHALEHVLCPWCELVRLRHKILPGARMVFVVPSASGLDDIFSDSQDINNHLHTWSPRTLANLFLMAGFKVDKVIQLKHQWPDNPESIFDQEGEAAFIQKGEEKNRMAPFPGCVVQIQIIAHRPNLHE